MKHCVCRRSASLLFFLFLFVRRPDERSEIRGLNESRSIVPGYRSAHPGYRLKWLNFSMDYRVKPGSDEEKGVAV
jgi:hypothetical protein